MNSQQTHYSHIIEILPQKFISIEMIKSYLKIDNDDDQFLNILINAAITSCENFTGISLIPKKLSNILYIRSGQVCKLSTKPIKEIIGIKICGENFDLANIEIKKNEGHILFPMPLFNQKLEVLYISGYDEEIFIGSPMVQGIFMHIAEMYDNGKINSITQDLEKLYRPYKRYQI